MSTYEIPEFSREIFRLQRADGPTFSQNEGKGRKFVAKGPLADAIIEMILTAYEKGETLTRKEIVSTTKCSASRVSEVVWVLEANYPNFDKSKAMKRKAKAVAAAEPTPAA